MWCDKVLRQNLMIRNTVGSGDASDKMTKDSSLIKFEFAGTPLGFSSSFDKSQVVVAGREGIL